MAATGREVTIQLPPASPRSRGLFVDVAQTISAEQLTVNGADRTGQGVQHQPWGCAPLVTGNLDCTADYLINGDGPALDPEGEVISENITVEKDAAVRSFDDVVIHPAFKVVDGLACSTLWQPDLSSASFTGITPRLLRRMRTLMSAALTGELITGYASMGPSFMTDAELLPSVSGMSEAAYEIEAHLAEALQGTVGTVFIPPALLHVAIEAGWVTVSGNTLLTVTGHNVVSDAGHVATQGVGSGGGSALWIYAAGEIAYRVSDTILLGEGSETLDISTNVRERLAEAYAQLAFDPCPLAAVAMDLGSLAPASGGEVVVLTQNEYDALVSPDSDTVYVIVG